MDIKDELLRLPKSWGFVAVQNKRPYQNDWQKNPLTRSQLFKEISEGRSTGIGVLAGKLSGGILFLDHDGQSASKILTENWGMSLGSLTPSWMVTSGRVGRYQLIYKVPERYWSKIKTRKFQTRKKTSKKYK